MMSDGMTPLRAFAACIVAYRRANNPESVRAAGGKADSFDRLKPFLTLDRAAVPYAQAAAELGLAEGAVRVAVHRLRRRYRELLRDEIAQTLADPAQVEQELRALFRAFGQRLQGCLQTGRNP